MTTRPRNSSFRERLRARQPLIGTFQKTPHHSVTDLLALSGLDCVCIDAEHAPFDRASIDTALQTARAADLPALVRVPEVSAPQILNALDLGATGVVLPHVVSPQDAKGAARLARFGPGGRGYSGSTRAAGYGTQSMPEILAAAAQSVTVIAQIEDAVALDHIDAISAIEDIDCLFIGRMDLTVSLCAHSADAPVVVDAVRRICRSGARAGRCVGMFVPNVSKARQWLEEGVSFFLLASDQQWVLQGARALVADFRKET